MFINMDMYEPLFNPFIIPQDIDNGQAEKKIQFRSISCFERNVGKWFTANITKVRDKALDRIVIH